jgi:peptidoglycan/LPS O-acetylase OafA/YrhL
MKTKHFHTLDALRFLAFFLVFILHLPFNTFPAFNYVKAGGSVGVKFFFVLSGFLITYIILNEKQQTNQLDLAHFFKRRILRIWPLFYLMIAFAFITPYLLSLLHLAYSNNGYTPNWLMSVLFLENYKMMFTHNVPNVSPLNVMWSLCVEEHFYIIFGLVFYFVSIKRIPLFFMACVIAANLARYICYNRHTQFLDITTNIDFFVFGALPAYWLITKEAIVMKKVQSVKPIYKAVLIVCTIVYIIVSPNLNYSGQALLEPSIFGVLFLSSILIVVSEETGPFKIGNKHVLSRLGVFTYGLYLMHTIVINLLVQVFKRLNWSLDNGLNAILFSILASMLAIIVSALSYYFFEKPFLNLKKILAPKNS